MALAWPGLVLAQAVAFVCKISLLKINKVNNKSDVKTE
jgi:hypothetical protein